MVHLKVELKQQLLLQIILFLQQLVFGFNYETTTTLNPITTMLSETAKSQMIINSSTMNDFIGSNAILTTKIVKVSSLAGKTNKKLQLKMEQLNHSTTEIPTKISTSSTKTTNNTEALSIKAFLDVNTSNNNNSNNQLQHSRQSDAAEITNFSSIIAPINLQIYTNGFTPQLLRLLTEKKTKLFASASKDPVLFPRIPGLVDKIKSQETVNNNNNKGQYTNTKMMLAEEKHHLDYFLQNLARNNDILQHFLSANGKNVNGIIPEKIPTNVPSQQKQLFNFTINNNKNNKVESAIRKHPRQTHFFHYPTRKYSPTIPSEASYSPNYAIDNNHSILPNASPKFNDINDNGIYGTSDNNIYDNQQLITMNAVGSNTIDEVGCGDCCQPICQKYIQPTFAYNKQNQQQQQQQRKKLFKPFPLPVPQPILSQLPNPRLNPSQQSLLPINSECKYGVCPCACIDNIQTDDCACALPNIKPEISTNSCGYIPHGIKETNICKGYEPCSIETNNAECGGCSKMSTKSGNIVNLPELNPILEREVDEFVNKLVERNKYKPCQQQSLNGYLSEKITPFYTQQNHFGKYTNFDSNGAQSGFSSIVNDGTIADADVNNNFYSPRDDSNKKKFFAVENPFTNKFFVEQSLSAHNLRGQPPPIEKLDRQSPEILYNPIKNFQNFGSSSVHNAIGIPPDYRYNNINDAISKIQRSSNQINVHEKWKDLETNSFLAHHYQTKNKQHKKIDRTAIDGWHQSLKSSPFSTIINPTKPTILLETY